jgi:excisionase family DNA binding protein
MPHLGLAVGVEDAAKLVGVGRTEIYKAIKQGSLASLKIGKRRLIRVEALQEWLASLENVAA